MKRREFLLSSAAAIAMPLPAQTATPLSVRIKEYNGWSITHHAPEYIGSYTPSADHLFGHTIGQHHRVSSNVWEEALWDEPLPGQWKRTTPPTMTEEDGILTITPGVWEIEDER